MLFLSENIILPSTLQILRRLMSDENLKDFFLVGGTGLALQIGHRYSVDLDLFCQAPFSTESVVAHLERKYNFHLTSLEPNTVLGYIENVKTDFISHDYTLCTPLIHQSSLRLASIKDIGAMKLNAIAHSGQRLKDFIDIYCILETIPLSELLEAYQIKYPNSSLLIPLKALTYFKDIDPKIDPPIMQEKIPFDKLKDRLKTATLNPTRTF